MAQSTGAMFNVCGPAAAVNANLTACVMAPKRMCRSMMGRVTAAYEHPCAPPLPFPSAMWLRSADPPLGSTGITHGAEVAVKCPDGLGDRTLGRPGRARQAQALPTPLEPDLPRRRRGFDSDAEAVLRLVRAGAIERRAHNSPDVELRGDRRQPERRLRVVDQGLAEESARRRCARRTPGPALI
jgi:hypothetical protein